MSELPTPLPGPEPTSAVSTSASVDETPSIAQEPVATGAGDKTDTVEAKEESKDATESAPAEARSSVSHRKIADQVEFYLSDHNLPFDKFLFDTTQGTLDSETQQSAPGTGWIALTTLLSFKRMRPYQSLGLEAVAAAVREHSSDLIEVNEEGTKCKRTRAIRQAAPGEVLARSVYVKGFPDEKEVQGLQEKLENWFRDFGRVNQVRMRREGGNNDSDAKNRAFKGSVFCEFVDEATAKSFLALDPKPTFPGQEEAVTCMPKKEYVDMKAKEKGIDMSSRNHNSKEDNARRGFNAFRLLREQKNDRRSNNRSSGGAGTKRSRDLQPEDLEITYNGKAVKITKEGTLREPEKLEYTKDSVIGFSGHQDRVAFKELKASLEPVQTANFVQAGRDQAGLVGFKDSVSDEKLKEIEDLKLKAGNSDGPLSWKRLSDKEQLDYHIDRATYAAGQHIDDLLGSSRSNDRDNKRERRDRDAPSRGRGRGRGGRGGGRGGGRDRNDRRDDRDRKEGDSPAKKSTTAIDIDIPFDEETAANKRSPLKKTSLENAFEDMPAKKEPAVKREREETTGDADEKSAKKVKTEA